MSAPWKGRKHAAFVRIFCFDCCLSPVVLSIKIDHPYCHLLACHLALKSLYECPFLLYDPVSDPFLLLYYCKVYLLYMHWNIMILWLSTVVQAFGTRQPALIVRNRHREDPSSILLVLGLMVFEQHSPILQISEDLNFPGIVTHGITEGLPHPVLQIGRASCRKECRSRWSPYH